MNHNVRIKLLIQLGDFILSNPIEFEPILALSFQNNNWFTIENQKVALDSIAKYLLQKDVLESFSQKYTEPKTSKIVGLIPAGNIPLVGFHDWMCIFLMGHFSQIKVSDKDPYWMPFLVEKMIAWNPAALKYFEFVEKLSGFEAVIATGSDNSARYFEHYFSKVPNIIRKNRNSIAILNGQETDEDIRNLSKDVFTYFGLGCRNVSKIYIPSKYDFNNLMEIFHENNSLILHNKYQNNYDYNIVLYMLNKIKYQNNGCIIITENSSLSSRIATLNYEYYDNINTLETQISEELPKIQCIISKTNFDKFETIPFGKSQQPEIDDFADGVDTMEFLSKL